MVAAYLLSICCCFLGLAKAVMASEGIGPPCAALLETRDSNCTSHNGKFGTCGLQCVTPMEPKFCCHEIGDQFLDVYFCCETPLDFAVVGGEEAGADEFPYMVALGWFSEEVIYEYNYKCGGVMISSKFAVTAAHCAFVNGLQPNVVTSGGFNFLVQVVLPVWAIDKVFVHPEYNEEYSYNDIALLRLVGNYPGPTLALWQQPHITNRTFTAIGYGDTFFRTSSFALLKVYLQFVSNSDCAEFYEDEENLPDGIMNTQICAKDPSNIMDTCQGDSGGPLIMTMYKNNGTEREEYLVGITSFGQGCALTPPGVYTRVWCFLTWMDEIMKPYQNQSTTGA